MYEFSISENKFLILIHALTLKILFSKYNF